MVSSHSNLILKLRIICKMSERKTILLWADLMLTSGASWIPEDERNGDTAEVPTLDCSPVRV